MARTITGNRGAFLDMLAISENTLAVLKASDDGYNVLVSSLPGHVVIFPSYKDHPRIKINIGRGLVSTAAGRYQCLEHIFDFYKENLHLTDFSPPNQDAIAIEQIKECHALPLIDIGDIEGAIEKVAHIWASLPGANYGQHENKITLLLTDYQQAGGTLHG